MMNKKLTLAAAIACSIAALSALAQTAYVRPAYSYPAPPPESGPASVQMGSSPFYIAPYIGVGVGRDDNLFLTPNNEKSSTFYVASPGLRIDARSGASVFQLTYQAQIGRYAQSRDDDYEDHTARAQKA